MKYLVVLTDAGKKVQANPRICSFEWPKVVEGEANNLDAVRQAAASGARLVWDTAGQRGVDPSPAADWFDVEEMEEEVTG